MAQAQAGSRLLKSPDDVIRRLLVEAIPHQGRIVVFLSNGAAFERATDGSWSRYEVAEGTIPDNRFDDMHAASIG